jgi:hypothetical protein
MVCPQNPTIKWNLNKHGNHYQLRMVDEVIYDKVGRTPQILNEK